MKISNNVMIVESLASSTFKSIVSETIKVPEGMMLVEGVLGVANVKNRNNRYYTFEEYQRHVNSFSQRIAETNGVFGEMEHPKSMNFDLRNVSHKVMEVRLDEGNGNVIGKLLLLDTPNGKIAQSIVRSGSSLPVSSRALGAVDPKSGETVLEYLSTWDLVGTSGFKQAAVNQLISESMESPSGMIVESLQINLDENNNFINEELGTTVHATEIKKLFEAYMAENNIVSTSENATTDEDIEQRVDELFAMRYAPIIESWMNTTFSSKFADGLQTWLVEAYAPEISNWLMESFVPELTSGIQSWITEHYTPEIADSMQSWITEEYTPEISNSIQSWITEEYTPEIAASTQSWITEHYTPKLTEGIESWINEGNITINGNAKPVNENVNVSGLFDAPAQMFKSAILESIQEKVNVAKSITPVEITSTRIDEALFKTGPSWLKNIPSQHKSSWSVLNESQRESVFRKAAIRRFDTQNDVSVFWDSIDFQSIVESGIDPKTISRTINENVNGSAQHPKSQIFALAKRFSQV